MAPGEKKWDAAAERDLCIALFYAANEGGRVTTNWPVVSTIMERLGYTFTKEALSQHWSKTILKDFKVRVGDLPETPKATPRKRKAKTVAEDGQDAVDTPKKSAKKGPSTPREKKSAVKAEETSSQSENASDAF
ncbi:hypothetical protein CDD80_6319 [Ophiocordyceps camponoti-rufipedis]|uniref:Myb-like domain-containing protein n=1 Tax=Ophiocordyceps camponoti-rufipedis TaxID=2004952 RepID=A0A2C5YQV9_9HYPO|nr:hypothetical protein CDD80_6319 [Ophiocordyceps camponoti-rufipedis]